MKIASLDALSDQNDTATWYTVRVHTSEGNVVTVSDTHTDDHTNRVAGGAACDEGTTAAEKRQMRRDDDTARKCLAAAVTMACAASSVAKAAIKAADKNDGMSMLYFLNHKYAATQANPNTAVELKRKLWSIEYGTYTIHQFLEKVEHEVNEAERHGATVTEGDKYAALIIGIEATDPGFADVLKGTMSTASTADKRRPYSFMHSHLTNDHPNRVASESAVALATTMSKLCQICGEPGHTAANCKARYASAAKQQHKRQQLKSKQQRRDRKPVHEKKADGTYMPTPEFNRMVAEKRRRREQQQPRADLAEFEEFDHTALNTELVYDDIPTPSNAPVNAFENVDNTPMPARNAARKSWIRIAMYLLAIAASCALAAIPIVLMFNYDSSSNTATSHGGTHDALTSVLEQQHEPEHSTDRGEVQPNVPKERLQYNEAYEATAASPDHDEAIPDSGASANFWVSKDSFDPETYKAWPPGHYVNVGKKGQRVEAIGSGDVPIIIKSKDGQQRYRVAKGVHTPAMARNLWSIGDARAHGTEVHFTKERSWIKSGSDEFPIDFSGNVPIIRFKSGPSVWGRRNEQRAFSADTSQHGGHAIDADSPDPDRMATLRRIHRVMGHGNLHDVAMTVKRGRLIVPPAWKDALLQGPLPKPFRCFTCPKAKSKKKARQLAHKAKQRDAARVAKAKQTAPKPTMPGTVIGVDVKQVRRAAEPNKKFPPGKQYCVGFVDYATDHAWTRFVKHKSQIDTALKEYVQHLHAKGIVRDMRNTGIQLVCDNEMIIGAFHRVMKDHGFAAPKPSPPYAHHKNGKIERYWDTLYGMANAQLVDAELPVQMIEAATLDATAKLNCTGRPHNGYVTPNELQFGHVPDVSHYNIFGSPAMVHVEKEHRAAGEDKSIMMIYCGVSPKHADTTEPAAKMLNIETQRWIPSIEYTVNAIDAQFDAKHFPELEHSLGAHIVQTEHENGIRSVAVDMSYAIDDLVHDYGLTEAHPVDNPVRSAPRYEEWIATSHAERMEMANKPVKPLVGSLTFISCAARPDIAQAVNMCARFQKDPSTKMWEALQRILLYLKGTRHKHLTYAARPSRNSMAIEMFVDASNKPCVAPGHGKDRSTTGILTFAKDTGGAYDWKVWRQTFVARNATEAEIIAYTDATPLLRYYRDFHEARKFADAVATATTSVREARHDRKLADAVSTATISVLRLLLRHDLLDADAGYAALWDALWDAISTMHGLDADAGYDLLWDALSTMPPSVHEMRHDRQSADANVTATTSVREQHRDRQGAGANVTATTSVREQHHDRQSADANVTATTSVREQHHDRQSADANVTATISVREQHHDRQSADANVTATTS
eukprot:g5242.t1